MKVNVFANLGGVGGYQILTERFLHLLNRNMSEPQKSINIIPVATGSTKDPTIKSMMDQSSKLLHGLHNTSIALLPMEQGLKYCGQKRIIYPAWEGSIIPQEVINILNTNDQVWASSKYTYDVMKKCGVEEDKLFHFPCFIDTQFEFKMSKDSNTVRRIESEPVTPEDPFVFLVIGKYEQRKASRETVEAFLKLFEDHPMRDSVLLKVKWSSSVYSRSLSQIKLDLTDLLKRYPKAASRIDVIDKHEASIIDLYNKADCLLIPSRAEGNGLPLFEAMALGLITICTPYSSFADYISEDSNIILPDRGMEDAYDEFFNINPIGFGQWGQVKVDDIMIAMEKALKMTTEERSKMSLSAANSMFKINYDAAYRHFKKAMEKLHGCEYSSIGSQS